jgi:FkbM family methyltransferase
MRSAARSMFGPFGGILGALPEVPGKRRLVDYAARVARWRGGSTREVFPWPGISFFVDLEDRIQRQMWCGCYESHVTGFLQAILRPGDTFMDVGANIGYHSLFAAKIVGSSGHVFAFEPDPALYVRLRRNLNQFSQASTFPYAVWDRDAEMTFERSPCSGESGWGTLAAVRDFEQGEHVQVQAVSLDSWNQQIRLNGLRAVKMDAEGSEPAVLRGAREILTNLRPVLLVEINDVLLCQGGGSAGSVANQLLAHKYRIYQLSRHRVRQMDSVAGCTLADYICFPEEAEPELVKKLHEHGYRS